MPLPIVSRCVRIQEVPSSSVVSLLYGKIFELKYFFLSSVWPAESSIYKLLSLSRLHVTM